MFVGFLDGGFLSSMINGTCIYQTHTVVYLKKLLKESLFINSRFCGAARDVAKEGKNPDGYCTPQPASVHMEVSPG